MGQADAEPSMVEEKVEKEPGGDQMNNSPGEYSSGVDIIALKVINHKKKHQKTSKKLQVTKVIWELMELNWLCGTTIWRDTEYEYG